MGPEEIETDSDGQPLYTTAEECARYDMLVWFYKDLCEMALKAMRDDPRMQPDDFAVACIQNSDRWEDLIDSLVEIGCEDPDYAGRADLSDTVDSDQESGSRYKGLTLLFAIFSETVQDIADEIPDCAQNLNAPVPQGLVKMIVLDEAGCSVYFINPASQRKQ